MQSPPRSSALDIPLVNGPYVSLAEAFAKGRKVDQLEVDSKLHPVMAVLVGNELCPSKKRRRR